MRATMTTFIVLSLRLGIQCERMRRFGIVAMQGFLFCRPMRAQELRQIIGAPIFGRSAERGREHDRLASGQLRKAVS